MDLHSFDPLIRAKKHCRKVVEPALGLALGIDLSCYLGLVAPWPIKNDSQGDSGCAERIEGKPGRLQPSASGKSS